MVVFEFFHVVLATQYMATGGGAICCTVLAYKPYCISKKNRSVLANCILNPERCKYKSMQLSIQQM